MNSETPITQGLRNVLVYVNLGGTFPPPPDSALDVALLRAANLAMRRKARGVTDQFLFIVAKADRSSALAESIQAYGFPSAEVMQLEQNEPEESIPDSDALREAAGNLIVDWLAEHHPGVLAYSRSDYDSGTFWWTGVEHSGGHLSWPFECSSFASELPAAHRGKGETWLAILAHALDLEADHASLPMELGQQRAAVAAATLCEWLHGFEAASENGYNHFEPDSAIGSLGISDLFLGFEASRLSGEDIEAFCEEHDADISDLGPATLSVLTREYRGQLRGALSEFFGGDGALLWVLHSSIWPQFDRPMSEALDGLLNECSLEEAMELEAPWLFVTEGWCEDADE